MNARYEFIDAEKATTTETGGRKYTVVKMCAWMEVSTSGFYEWREPAAVGDRGSAGPFDAADREGVHRLRRDLRVPAAACPAGPVGRALHPGAGPGADAGPGPGRLPAAAVAAQPDRVRRRRGRSRTWWRRDFTADAPGTKLVGDITYIPTWEGWLYLATVIDCHTKACSGGRWPGT